MKNDYLTAYTPLQKKMHTDVLKAVTKKKYHVVDADEMFIVFGRVYATYVLSQLKKNGTIEWRKTK